MRLPAASSTLSRIRTQAIVVAGACLATLLGVALLVASELRAADEASARSDAIAAARRSASNLDAAIRRAQVTLTAVRTLATSVATRPALDSAMRRLYQQGEGQIDDIVIHAADGAVLAAANLTSGVGPSELSQRARAALQSGAFTFDGVHRPSNAGRGYTMRFVQAIPQAQQRTAVPALVSVSLALDAICLVPCTEPSPEGVMASIADLNGTIVYRTLDPEGWIGRRYRPDTGMVNNPERTEWSEVNWLSDDGHRRLIGTHRLSAVPWLLYIGFDKRVYFGDAQLTHLGILGVKAAGVMLLVIGLCFGFASSYITRIEVLTDDARAIAAGRIGRHVRVNQPDEIGALEAAFNQMSDALIERDRALQANYEQLLHAQKMEALGTFSGGIAHDFNNYLHSIIVHAEMAAYQVGPAAPALRDVNGVLSAAGKAANLARQILDFGRKDGSSMGTCDANAVVLGIEHLLRRLLGVEHVLELQTASEAAWVPLSQSELEQVVVNLASNARDAMSTKGHVRLTVTVTHGDGAGGVVALRVRDTGSGIAPDIASRIFEPFFSTKGRKHGTGLGLSVSFGIVQRAGGSIRIDETGEGGTTMLVEMALAQPSPDRITSSPEVPSAPTARERPTGTGCIALVDDDAEVLESTGRLLSECGFEVSTFSDGAAALARLAAVPEVNLLMTDVVMPGISGPALAAAVRSLRPELPVLFLSGFADEDAVQSMLGMQSVSLIRKPCGSETLLSAVRLAMQQGDPEPATVSPEA